VASSSANGEAVLATRSGLLGAVRATAATVEELGQHYPASLARCAAGRDPGGAWDLQVNRYPLVLAGGLRFSGVIALIMLL
jgi:hypothetical protein